MADNAPTDQLLARQQYQLTAEIGSMRDGGADLTAIAKRRDGTLETLLTEIRALTAVNQRLSAGKCP